jgi:ATP-dependent helicase HrpB
VSQLLAWAPITRADLERHPGFRVADELTWDPAERRVLAWKTTFFHDLPLERRSVPNTDRARSGELLATYAASALDEVFGGLTPDDLSLLARVATFFRVFPECQSEVPGDPCLSREQLLRAALPAMSANLSSLDDLKRRPAIPLREAVMALLPWSLQRRLKDALPERMEVPSGSHPKLEYRFDGAPILAAKVQELFGLAETPRVGEGRLPVVLHLLNPAQNPLQVTTDLASFWTRTWPAVRAEMRTRYPKHFWPEDPARATASTKTTARHFRATGKDGG